MALSNLPDWNINIRMCCLLHEYLYGADKYVISGTVKQISSNIESISGVKSQKVKVTTEAPGDGISDGSDEDGDLRTITTPPKGMIVEE